MYKSLFSIVAALGIAVFLGGCASATVTATEPLTKNLPKPDMIVVYDFAVTPNDVNLDKGIMQTVYRDSQGRAPSADEERAGRLVANKLSQRLVEQLNKDGIKAVRGNSGAQPTDTSLILTGQFVTVDQGNQSERVWIGFGLGGSQLRTRGQLVQDGKLVATGETSTKASLTPGMIVGLATGSAAGTVASSAAMGVAGAGVSETFLASVEADASRTADQIAVKVHNAYVDRGWLSK